MEKLKTWNEAYELLQEMKPKHPEKETIAKLTEVMRLYNKTIDMQNKNLEEMEENGLTRMNNMTKEEIEFALSEVVAERSQILEYIEQEALLHSMEKSMNFGAGTSTPWPPKVGFGDIYVPQESKGPKPPDIPPEYFEQWEGWRAGTGPKPSASEPAPTGWGTSPGQWEGKRKDWDKTLADHAGWSNGNEGINPADRTHLNGWVTLKSQSDQEPILDSRYKSIQMAEVSINLQLNLLPSLAQTVAPLSLSWSPVHKTNTKKGKRLVLEPYLDMFFELAEVFPQMFVYSDNHDKIIGFHYTGDIVRARSPEQQKEKVLAMARQYAKRCKSDASIKRIELYEMKGSHEPDITLTVQVGRGGWVDISSKEKIAWPRINTY